MTSRRRCSTAHHNLLKLDPYFWPALPLLGVQDVPADESGPGYQVLLKQCPDCGSTLGREVGR